MNHLETSLPTSSGLFSKLADTPQDEFVLEIDEATSHANERVPALDAWTPQTAVAHGRLLPECRTARPSPDATATPSIGRAQRREMIHRAYLDLRQVFLHLALLEAEERATPHPS